jgi:small subunit ribosomal protein S2
VAGGGNVLFVGTKKQAQDPVRSYAEKCGMPYVNERWLGGMLTNFETMSKRVGKMLEYERMKASGEFEVMIKKEALLLGRELEKLQRNLGGLRGMKQRPDAIFVLDTKKEHIAVTEANKLGIPVVAVVDTNVDPDVIQYPIPGNDDAIRANSLLTRVIADAVEEGRYIAAKRNPIPAPPQRSAEEDAAFEKAQADARNAAAQAQAERDARLRAPKPDPAADDTGEIVVAVEAAEPDAAPATPDDAATETEAASATPAAAETATAAAAPAEAASATPDDAETATAAPAPAETASASPDAAVTVSDTEPESPAQADPASEAVTAADVDPTTDTVTPAATTAATETETES